MSTDRERAAELQALREQCERLDEELVSAIDRRAELAQKVRALTEGSGQAPSDGDEALWLSRLVARAKHVSAPNLRAILRDVRAAMRNIEEPARIAYVGPEDGHCREVVRRHFGADAPLLECANVAETLEAVTRERAACAVIPFESSEEGISQPAVLALATSELVIIGERTLTRKFDLISAPGVSLSDVTEVVASAAALSACESYLRRRFPAARVVELALTKDAIEQSLGEPHRVAIVAQGAPFATQGGEWLAVREENVGDVPDAFTRYVVVAARPARRAERNTTCVVFGVQDRPGSLFEVLRYFAERGLNLGKVQSRPLAQAAHLAGPGWDYIFYAEVDGHETDRAMLSALDSVKRSAKFFRVLGSYPAEPPP